MIGIILALIVAFLKSLGELAGKTYTDIQKKDTLDEYILAWGTRVFSFLILLPLIFWVGFPLLSVKLSFILLFTSLLGAITTITALKAVKYGDLSLVSPLTALTVPFLLVTGFIINRELPNTYGFLGVGAIFFGTYFLNIQEIRGGILAPIQAVFQNLGARYMLITAVLWSLTAPFDKIGVLEVGAIEWMFLSNALISFLFIFIMIGRKKSLDLRVFLLPKNVQKVFILSFLGGVGVFLQMLALKYTLVIYVIALKRASGMFSVLLGWIFFKEKNILQKLTAASIMILGVAIITLGGNI